MNADLAGGDAHPGAARLATRADLPALVALMGEFYAEAGFPLAAGPARRAFEALLDDPRLGAVWLLEHAGEAAGFVVLTVSFSMEFGGLRGFVDDFFVRPSRRRLGLGGAALAAVREACLGRGVRALLVETSEDNPGAVRVYRRAGFAPTGHLLMIMPLEAPLHER